MRLSGVDPGIIRELSGIYKPFVKAFKELISNAYDADATDILVAVADDYSWIDIKDDGNGMTPYSFHQDFARLGGSTAWQQGGKSPGGRDRIGYKGIGFLAVARYCKALEVTTRSLRPHTGTATIQRRGRQTIPFEDIVGDLVPAALLEDRITVTSVSAVSTFGGTSRKLKARDFTVSTRGITLNPLRARSVKSLKISFEVDCSHIVLRARLDFDYLLGLERQADLRLLEDFCTVEFDKPPKGEKTAKALTNVRLSGLKDFVVRELAAPQTRGKARNMVFKNGREQFLWRLSRCAPLGDEAGDSKSVPEVAKALSIQEQAKLPRLRVQWRSEKPAELRRPIYLPKVGRAPLVETMVPVSIDEGGIRAHGYLLARNEVIYPAELRGISVRVRNVAIGEPSFFGWENILSGPRKSALSQITGEIIVVRGLEASDAINPGRESFYEESRHYRILRHALFGSEEAIGGLVGQAIRSILDRIHVRSQITEKLGAAKTRRKTLSEISSAVSFYTREASAGTRLSEFFSQPIRANGLADARDVQLRPSQKLAGFDVESVDDLSSEFQIDFLRKRVKFDFKQDAWDSTIYLDGHYYKVHFKQGRPEHPICEFDNERRRIYVNWGHPVKLQMDDVGFLKAAILLRLATHAAPSDGNAMMDLALKMLSFRTE